MRILLCALLLAASLAHAQVYTEINPDSAYPHQAGWMQGYHARRDSALYARTYQATNGYSGVDEGKTTWNRLLAELFKARGSLAAVQNLINTTGAGLIRSTWAGCFCGPFSVPGYTHYYMLYRNLLPQEQRDSAYRNMYGLIDYRNRCGRATGWDLVSHPDGHMDPVYNVGSGSYLPNGTEFNSENYHWMQRMGGYLWAEAFADTARLPFYKNFAHNMGRALLNAGRVEWNSANYWGHTFNPLAVLYRHAQDTAVHRIAKAAMDWEVAELAIHYLDGFYIAGADTRAKNGAYKPFTGSAITFGNVFFADVDHRPSFGSIWHKTVDLDTYVGFLPHTAYAPPQQLVDIAHRNVALPIEIHSAKPFYRIDSAEYADWAGATTRSRRNEFETLYLDSNYSLGSLATYRPSGLFGPFSEQSLWRLGVVGAPGGLPVQIMGGAGPFIYPAGRCAQEEIGQYRNVLLRVAKGADSLWVGVPSSVAMRWVGDTAFADLGQGVYMALTPYGTAGHAAHGQPGDDTYSRYTWEAPGLALAALALEVGTARDYGSFAAFIAAVQARSAYRLYAPDDIEYSSAAGHTLTLGYQPTTSYNLMAPTPNVSVIDPAGVVPALAYDGRPNDFSTWNSYEVVYGEDVIRQDWGGGALHLRTRGQGLRISADAATGNIHYATYDAPPVFVSPTTATNAATGQRQLAIYPNPARHVAWVSLPAGRPTSTQLSDAAGKPVNISIAEAKSSLHFNLGGIPSGMYVLRIRMEDGRSLQGKVVIE